MINDISCIDSAGELIKKIRQGQISETDAIAEISSIDNILSSELKNFKESVSVQTLLNIHSSENFSFFSGIYDFEKSVIIKYSGEQSLSDLVSACNNIIAEEKIKVEGISSPLFISKKYNSYSVCSLSSSDYFDEKVFSKFAEIILNIYTFQQKSKSDLSGTFSSILKEFSSFASNRTRFCEIFRISNLKNTFSHTGFHNIMKVCGQLKEYFKNNDEESRLFALSPDMYLVIRNNPDKLIDNPHFELQNIPLKIEKRIIEVRGKEQYADFLRHISG
ncbi:MAG TPA: hypothetical protein PK419_08540 [Spirochaetota bacterium]|jgi:hypothetical protein|nr:hypothetical protein [Spirochaetota bacterium]HPW51284.1 hypothetical protein [Spirochaetota bacterium]HPY02919.1 hypothetical protein [Spirochaetota bacterium]HQA52890.1 hypothetical protein [Spirochaetota bacterium]